MWSTRRFLSRVYRTWYRTKIYFTRHGDLYSRVLQGVKCFMYNSIIYDSVLIEFRFNEKKKNENIFLRDFFNCPKIVISVQEISRENVITSYTVCLCTVESDRDRTSHHRYMRLTLVRCNREMIFVPDRAFDDRFWRMFGRQTECAVIYRVRENDSLFVFFSSNSNEAYIRVYVYSYIYL